MSDIPFANMSQEEAEKEPFSPYADFCNSLRDYYIFERETRRSITKGELFAKFGHDKRSLSLLKSAQHPDYKFINKKEW